MAMLRRCHFKAAAIASIKCPQSICCSCRKPFSTTTAASTLTNVNDFVSAAQSNGPRVFVSTLRDPFLNLALEDFIFKSMPNSTFKETTQNQSQHHDRLLLYVNDPCVVIGRNQNPWQECNVPLVKELGIPLVRRKSGGGTVVHDAENVNFSVMTGRDQFARENAVKMIVEAVNQVPEKVQKLLKPQAIFDDIDDADTGFNVNIDNGPPFDPEFAGTGLPFPGNLNVLVTGAAVPILVNGPQVKLKVNSRFDIVAAVDGTDQKVSGSAYKIARDKVYHHGTMLLNSKLDVLNALLARDETIMGVIHGRGVKSVKSPVTNLGMDKDAFMDTVVDAFMRNHAAQELEISNKEASEDYNPLTVGLFSDIETNTDRSTNRGIMFVNESHLPAAVHKTANEFASWSCVYGQTPDFTHVLTYLSDIGQDLKLEFTVQKGFLTRIFFLNQEEHGTSLAEIDSGLADLQFKMEHGAKGPRYTAQELGEFMQNSIVKNWIQNAIDGVAAVVNRPM